MSAKIWFGVIYLLFSVTCVPTSFAQEDKEVKEKRKISDKIFFGGNLWLQFGTITRVEVSPLVGYKFTPRIMSGIGGTYEFYRDNYFRDPITTHIYGGRVFSSYILIKDLNEVVPIRMNSSIMLHGEYELLSLESRYFDFTGISEDDRFLLHNILIGGGLRQPLGPRSAFYMLVLFNINESARSPYSNPVIRIGFNF